MSLKHDVNWWMTVGSLGGPLNGKMHLGWFGEEDASGAESGDASNGAGLQGFHNPGEAGDDDFEVLVAGRDEIPDESGESDEFKGKTRDELLAELKKERDEKTALAAKADTSAALLQGLKELKGGVAPVLNAPTTQTQMQAQEQYKPLTPEDINPVFIDDPFAHTTKIVQDQLRKLEPVFQKTLLMSKQASRRLAEIDPTTKEIMDLYGPEVEQEVAGTSLQDQLGNVDIYQQAAQRVKLKHLSDIESKAVANAVAAKDAEIAKLKAVLAKGGGKPYNETGGRPSPSKKTVIATKEDVSEAAMLGMDIKDYMRTKDLGRSE